MTLYVRRTILAALVYELKNKERRLLRRSGWDLDCLSWNLHCGVDISALLRSERAGW